MRIHKYEVPNAIGYRNGGIRIVLLLLGIPIFLFFLALVILWIPLPGLVADPGSKGRNMTAAMSVGILGFGILVALFAYLRKILKTASHCMDEYFYKKGLVVTKAYGYGRSFQGTLNAIQIEGFFLPSYYLQPWRLYITMHKEVGIVGEISNRKPLINHYCKPYHPEGSFSPYFAISTEPKKLNQFLNDPFFEKTIHGILREHMKQDTWKLRFYGKRIEFHSCQYVFHLKEMEASLDTFFSLLQPIP